MIRFAGRAQLRRAARPFALFASLIALGVSLCVLCAPASAQVATVEGHLVGVQPREIAAAYDGNAKSVASFANAQGNPVMHTVAVHVVYWDPQHFYHGDWQRFIDTFMQNVGLAGGQLSNVFAVDSQYSDSTNLPAAEHFVFKGAADDYNEYPALNGCADPHAFLDSGVPRVKGQTVCLSDEQVQTELKSYIAQHALPQGLGTLYVLLTPPGLAVCLDGGGEEGHCSDFAGGITQIEADEAAKAKAEEKNETYTEPPNFIGYKRSFCSYHRTIGEATETPYAVVPWTAGTSGDFQIGPLDRSKAFACQDGGFFLSEGHLVKEAPKEKTKKEEEEFENKDQEEKRKQLAEEEKGLEGPHVEEPNQIEPERSEDGSFDTALPDLLVNQIALELQNTVTNPLLNAWQDSAGLEATDECRNFFLPIIGGSAKAHPETEAATEFNQELASKTYYMGDAFDLAALKLNYPGVRCLPGVNLDPHFTAPTAVNSGEIVDFDGMESNITLNWGTYFPPGGSAKATYDVYTWDFGDGTPTVTGYAPATAQTNSPEGTPCPLPWIAPCAGSVFHSYQYGGTYQVTLTARDVGGNTASYSAPVTVVGSPAPAPHVESSGAGAGAGAGGGAGGAAGGSAGQGAAGTSQPSHIPPPTAAASIASKSLKLALRKGLAVSYSVNEQVAGHFEVLLSRAIARKLGITGTPAFGLPAGTPPQVIIAKAVLVTTTAGHSTVRIQFSKRTAARLAKVHKVTLMLRLIVRNAASHSPATTTVLSSYTLSG